MFRRKLTPSIASSHPLRTLTTQRFLISGRERAAMITPDPQKRHYFLQNLGHGQVAAIVNPFHDDPFVGCVRDGRCPGRQQDTNLDPFSGHAVWWSNAIRRYGNSPLWRKKPIPWTGCGASKAGGRHGTRKRAVDFAEGPLSWYAEIRFMGKQNDLFF
jgi:hypothetical protein